MRANLMWECITCGRNRSSRFYKGARGRICATCRKKTRQRAARGTHVQRAYNITMKEHDLILELQGGVCWPCGRRARDVDHDHQVEKSHGMRYSVRGILCRSCNKTLHYVKDDPGRLRRLALYLEHPPAWDVIESDELRLAQ